MRALLISLVLVLPLPACGDEPLEPCEVTQVAWCKLIIACNNSLTPTVASCVDVLQSQEGATFDCARSVEIPPEEWQSCTDIFDEARPLCAEAADQAGKVRIIRDAETECYDYL